jgi:hypothetical protein
MSEFSDLEKKAESYAKDHPEEVDKGLDEAAQYAERETGHKHDSQIQRGEEAVEKRLGAQDQGQAGSQGGQG